MNILTYDIEEWFINKQLGGEDGNSALYDYYLDAILNLLDENHLKATFFCVGEMGASFPRIIRKIYLRGHEIGCHSNIHTWLNKMTVSECQEDTHRAIDSLEQCIGEKVKSYRAPAFSIGDSNKWAFEILAENGIERDASIFPATRDFGGFPLFGQNKPCFVEYNGIKIKEFPVRMARVFGNEVAFSGGGYFRFFPLNYVVREIDHSHYSMCYFHIGDLIPELNGWMSRQEYESYFKEEGSLKNRCIRHFKSNIGKRHAFDKMAKLVRTIPFMDISQAVMSIDWASAPIVVL